MKAFAHAFRVECFDEFGIRPIIQESLLKTLYRGYITSKEESDSIIIAYILDPTLDNREFWARVYDPRVYDPEGKAPAE